jgi:adenine phosphoribosyltransferase
MDLKTFLRDVPDFPQPGIVFKDISPLLASPDAMQHCVHRMADMVHGTPIDRIAAIESRGFLFGMPLAMHLGIGFTLIRKPGKLPWRTNRIEYSLEYGTDALEIHQDGVERGHRVLMVDDLLATGGTAKAACDLVEGLGGSVAGCLFAVELRFLSGRARLEGQRVHAVMSID